MTLKDNTKYMDEAYKGELEYKYMYIVQVAHESGH